MSIMPYNSERVAIVPYSPKPATVEALPPEAEAELPDFAADFTDAMHTNGLIAARSAFDTSWEGDRTEILNHYDSLAIFAAYTAFLVSEKRYSSLQFYQDGMDEAFCHHRVMAMCVPDLRAVWSDKVNEACRYVTGDDTIISAELTDELNCRQILHHQLNLPYEKNRFSLPFDPRFDNKEDFGREVA